MAAPFARRLWPGRSPVPKTTNQDPRPRQGGSELAFSTPLVVRITGCAWARVVVSAIRTRKNRTLLFIKPPHWAGHRQACTSPPISRMWDNRCAARRGPRAALPKSVPWIRQRRAGSDGPAFEGIHSFEGAMSRRFGFSTLEREAGLVAALNHPHICQLYDVGRITWSSSSSMARHLRGPCRQRTRSELRCRSSKLWKRRTDRASSTGCSLKWNFSHKASPPLLPR